MLKKRITTLKGERILVAPLDWGLGHATRCVPIIDALIAANKHVILAGEGLSGQLLRTAYPTLEYVHLTGIHFKYSTTNTQVVAVLRQIPHILKAIKDEYKTLQDIVIRHNIDVVISDNRFGLYTSKCYCVYMTHQLMIKTPASLKFTESLLWYLHRRYINRYDECWIPDLPADGNLSGDLAHKYPLPHNAHFIGILSRFADLEIDQTLDLKKYTHLVVISGAEPQRTMFEQWALTHFTQKAESTLVVRGKPDESSTIKTDKELDMVSHLPDNQLHYHLNHAKNIYCRSGYSSLMDLSVIGRTAILIPTPGQTEQEYLAYLHNGTFAKSHTQKKGL